ncbi:uncharacterized protein TNCV_502481 [Trichonephila clavipes]|nr:uncharacterized protein TNCV_502481 [Trichonephila clavipes]
MGLFKNCKDFFKDLRSDTAFNEMLCDARELADEIDILANFELTQPRHRVRRRDVNFYCEAQDDPIKDPTLKYKAEFCFFTLERDKAINALKSRYKRDGPGRRDSSSFVALLNKKESAIEILKFISNLEFAPTLGIFLRILLTLPISVESGEKNFSKLKLIKKKFRSTTTEDRLNGLTTIAIEHELAEEINEDFGKRNMSGKRARRHSSQLSEFERGLIIGMKTTGWSTRRVASQVDRSQCAVRNCWDQ